MNEQPQQGTRRARSMAVIVGAGLAIGAGLGVVLGSIPVGVGLGLVAGAVLAAAVTRKRSGASAS